jgi:hypothetical protein
MALPFYTVFWHIDPLLGKDLETNYENIRCHASKQTAVSEQQLGKHVPAEMNTNATIDDGVFDMVRTEKL